VAFIPDIPRLIYIDNGQGGSAKTTRQKILKSLIDPSIIETETFSGDALDLIRKLSHHYAIFFDNVSYLFDWQSDLICQACTGGGGSKRMLYTDDDDFVYRFKRLVALNGISLVVNKPDLLDRSFVFQVPRLKECEVKDEKQLFEEFNLAKPKILGAIFTTLSNAMKIYPDIRLKGLPRMSDFYRWGISTCRALGIDEKDFNESYQRNVESRTMEIIETSPIAQAILTFIKDKEYWEGSPSHLLDILTKYAQDSKINIKSRLWPKDPRWLWRRIVEALSGLNSVGIKISRNKETNRMIRIQKAEKNDVDDVDKRKHIENQEVMGQQHTRDNTDIIFSNFSVDDVPLIDLTKIGDETS
jgi:hypothetical protein